MEIRIGEVGRVVGGNDAGRNYQRGRNTVKALFIGSIFFGGLLAIAAPSFAEDSPPAAEQARKVEALVNNAAALADKQGKAAFAEFRKKDSEWFRGDTYIFAYDLKGNVLLNPAFPQREGTNVAGQKDAMGKPFQDEILEVAATKGSGWVSYMFPKPGQSEPSQKWTYVKKVTLDGVPGLVASGFYPE
jgi:cytochrome c